MTENAEKNSKDYSMLGYKRRCTGIRDELYDCLIVSDCCQKEKKTPKQCIQEHHPSVEQCQVLRNALFECRRSSLDRRLQFRGMGRGYS